jgi:hypothetical protein
LTNLRSVSGLEFAFAEMELGANADSNSGDRPIIESNVWTGLSLACRPRSERIYLRAVKKMCAAQQVRMAAGSRCPPMPRIKK